MITLANINDLPITGTSSPETREEADALLQAMRDAVRQVPSYVNVQGYKRWLENRLEEEK